MLGWYGVARLIQLLDPPFDKYMARPRLHQRPTSGRAGKRRPYSDAAIWTCDGVRSPRRQPARVGVDVDDHPVNHARSAAAQPNTKSNPTSFAPNVYAWHAHGSAAADLVHGICGLDVSPRRRSRCLACARGDRLHIQALLAARVGHLHAALPLPRNGISNHTAALESRAAKYRRKRDALTASNERRIHSSGGRSHGAQRRNANR